MTDFPHSPDFSERQAHLHALMAAPADQSAFWAKHLEWSLLPVEPMKPKRISFWEWVLRAFGSRRGHLTKFTQEF